MGYFHKIWFAVQLCSVVDGIFLRSQQQVSLCETRIGPACCWYSWHHNRRTIKSHLQPGTVKSVAKPCIQVVCSVTTYQYRVHYCWKYSLFSADLLHFCWTADFHKLPQDLQSTYIREQFKCRLKGWLIWVWCAYGMRHIWLTEGMPYKWNYILTYCMKMFTK